MKHFKYPKIPTPTSTTGQELLNHVRSIYGSDSHFWLPTEKLHGTNFGIYFSSSGVKFASRNQFVGDDYYGAQPVIKDVVHRCAGLFEEVAPKEDDFVERGMQQLVLYGEIVGRGVQKGILYDVKGLGGQQDRAFVIFDMLRVVRDCDIESLSWTDLDEVRQLLMPRGLNVIAERPPVTLDEALGTDPDMPSNYSSEGSPREGNVYRFCDPHARGPHGERMMFKIKSERFSEVSRRKRENKGAEVEQEFASAALALINGNRMDSAMSRIGLTRQTFRPSKFGDLLREMGGDVIADLDRHTSKVERKFVMLECKNLIRRELF